MFYDNDIINFICIYKYILIEADLKKKFWFIDISF